MLNQTRAHPGKSKFQRPGINLLPDLPTVSEFVPTFEASGWLGIGAPNNTSSGVIDRLNREINAGLTDWGLQAKLADLGLTPIIGSPADSLIVAETDKWAISNCYDERAPLGRLAIISRKRRK